MNRFYSIFLVLFFIGCATQRPVEKPSQDKSTFPPEGSFRQERTVDEDPFIKFPEKYYRKAIHLEKDGDLLQALAYWRVVQRFRPNDPEVSKKVLEGEAWIRRESEKHFLKGLEKLGRHQIEEARREFLLALTYHPEHPEALNYLKDRLNDPVWTFYEVKKGDSLKQISQGIYKDPDKDFLIAYFNPLQHQAPLPPGLVLKLPVLPSIPIDQKVSPKEISPKAPNLFKSPQLDISAQEQADIHYAKGMKYFLTDELEKAIEQWKETLRINPNHPHAKRDLQRAQNLLKKLGKPP